MIQFHAPGLLAGLLGAGVFAAIMSSLDSQVLSLGTMFTKDIVVHFGFHDRMSERKQVLVGRAFVAGILVLTFLLSFVMPRDIFRLGVWSFAGFASLFPIVLAALFWKRSSKFGVLASILSTVVLWIYFFVQSSSHPGYTVGGTGIIPAAVMVVVSGVVLVGVSLVTPPPAPHVVARFFPKGAS
jgi:SSS family solute:Na+ symporter